MCAYFATEYDNDEFLQGLLANLFFIIDDFFKTTDGLC